MRKYLVTILSLFAITACLGPPVDELDFFEVTLESIEAAPELGAIELRGLLKEPKTAVLEEHGFAWSTDFSSLENLAGDIHWIPLSGAPAEPTFYASVSGLSLDSVYYFLAYAKSGERRALSAIQSFSLGVNLTISREVLIDNDSAVLTGFIQGLQQPDVNISVKEHGFVWSETAVYPEYGIHTTLSIPEAPLNDDGPFKATAKALDFNRRYFVRAFAKPEGRPPYYSDTLSFRMADGWKLGGELPFALFNASSASLRGKGYVVFGCLDLECLARSSQLWEYDPGQDGWREKAPFDGNFASRHRATAFAIGDTLYIGFGLGGQNSGYLTNFWKIAPQADNSWIKLENQPPPEMLPRSDALAFVIQDKAYLGAGRTIMNGTEKALNDFWQYDPATGRWKKMAGLWRSTPNPEYKGRFNAAAFAIGNNGYIGSGADIGLVLQDFWEFTPPTNPQDTGSWRWHSNFPGTPRFSAASFAIGSKGYLGGGQIFTNSFYLGDFWEFTPSQAGNEAWMEASHFRGATRTRAFSFAIQENGYIGGGETRQLNENDVFISAILKSFWTYTPKR